MSFTESCMNIRHLWTVFPQPCFVVWFLKLLNLRITLESVRTPTSNPHLLLQSIMIITFIIWFSEIYYRTYYSTSISSLRTRYITVRELSIPVGRLLVRGICLGKREGGRRTLCSGTLGHDPRLYPFIIYSPPSFSSLPLLHIPLSRHLEIRSYFSVHSQLRNIEHNNRLSTLFFIAFHTLFLHYLFL